MRHRGTVTKHLCFWELEPTQACLLALASLWKRCLRVNGYPGDKHITILGILSSFKNDAPVIHHLSSGSSYVFGVMSVLVATFFFMTQLTRGVSLSEKLLPRLHLPRSLLRSKAVQHSHARSCAQVTLTL